MKKALLIVLSAIIACIAAATLTACYIGNGGNSGHTHNYVWIDNGNGTHKQHCAVDGCNEPDVNVGSHTFGADGKCVCGAEKPTEHKHAYTEKVVESKYLKTAATCNAKAVYYYSCKCGEKGTETFEYGEKSSHTFNKQVVSELYIKSSATCAKKAEYYYSCECGEKGTETFEYGDKLPHTFDKQVVSKLYIKSSATCMTKAEYYYSCECGEKGTETFIDENGEFSTEAHPYEDVWYNDEQFHYHKSSCSHAVVKDKTAHSFGENDTCTVCGCRKTSTGLSFKYNSDYTGYILTGIGTCKDVDVIVPSAYNEKPVVEISSNAFSNSSITSIIIPDGVTSIGYSAFFGCSSLKSITIPDSVNYIGYSAFENCIKLKNVTLGEGITYIYSKTFLGCSSLESICIPDRVNYISYSAFENCVKLKSVTLGKETTTISHRTFYGCNLLANITIHKNLISIEDYAFYGCSSLTDINIPDSIENIGYNVFENCNRLKFNMYDNAEYLGNANNKFLVLIKAHPGGGVSATSKIHNKCRLIGSSAFSNCSLLTEINIPDSVYFLGAAVFSGCTSLKNVNLGNCVTELATSTFSGCSSLKTITNLTNITSIGYSAFSGCTSLQNVAISNDITKIGENAFYGCDSLKYNLYDNCRYLGNEDNQYVAFIQPLYVNGTSYEIHENCRIIADKAFFCSTAGVRELKEIKIPDNVKHIGYAAFENCTKLIEVEIGKGVNIIKEATFYNCMRLFCITIPDSVIRIEYNAFNKCGRLHEIYYSGSINDLVQIEGVKNIMLAGTEGKVLRVNGKMITEVNITVTGKINEGAFGGFNITSVNIGNNVTSIGSYAFKACSSLQKVTIGNNVTSIENNAFDGCNKLFEVFYCGTAEQWGKIKIFDGNNKLKNATLYYYSESKPAESGNYWHYVDGKIVIW